MREYLLDLRGRSLPTVVTGASNKVIDVVGSSVIVGTTAMGRERELVRAEEPQAARR